MPIILKSISGSGKHMLSQQATDTGHQIEGHLWHQRVRVGVQEGKSYLQPQEVGQTSIIVCEGETICHNHHLQSQMPEFVYILKFA